MPSSLPLLPSDIANSHAYLTSLLETCAQLPFKDVARTLRHAFEQERAKGFYTWAEFLDRLPNYIERHLSQKIQDQLNVQSGLMSSFRRAIRMAERRPENWPFWGPNDHTIVEDRRNALCKDTQEAPPEAQRAEEHAAAIARLDLILAALDSLKKVNGLAVNASEIDRQLLLPSRGVDFPVRVCPLTGLQTNGRLRLESTADGHILYTFKPIGSAFFEVPLLKSLAADAETLNLPLTDWAGLCRQAYELEEKVPIFSSLLKVDSEHLPTTFDEKRSHFLQLLYKVGGNEYKERNIFIHDDFPLAFAKNAEEFTRILKSLITEGWLEYDKPDDKPNDWVGGIRTHYNSVLISREGMKRVKESLEPSSTPTPIQTPTAKPNSPTNLTHLHPAVQQAVGSRFADGYYSDSLHKACTALEKAVQDKANQPPEPTGATLMSKVFSKDKPVLMVSANQGEQEGYMFLYRGLTQAIRNHYAHNDPATDPARALEWLCFISALFYKLDEAQP